MIYISNFPKKKHINVPNKSLIPKGCKVTHLTNPHLDQLIPISHSAHTRQSPTYVKYICQTTSSSSYHDMTLITTLNQEPKSFKITLKHLIDMLPLKKSS